LILTGGGLKISSLVAGIPSQLKLFCTHTHKKKNCRGRFPSPFKTAGIQMCSRTINYGQQGNLALSMHAA
jgi:hypothetical protein